MRTLLVLSLGFALATAAFAIPLDVVTVGAPAINCKFDTDCTITVDDTAAHFTLAGTAGDAFLQSRTFPPGEAGTAAAGLQAYEYRVDLTQLAGLLALPCVSQLSLDFGPVAAADYDGNGNTDQVYVVTSGGLGTIGLASAEQTGDRITFTFSSAVCSGSAPGNGDTSFFFGLASTQPPRHVTAEAVPTLGSGPLSLDARAPQLAGGGGGSALGLVPAGGFKPGTVAILHVTGARPGARIELYSGTGGGKTPVASCRRLALDIGRAALAFRATADAQGNAVVKVAVPVRLRGKSFRLQAVDLTACRTSKAITAMASK